MKKIIIVLVIVLAIGGFIIFQKNQTPIDNSQVLNSPTASGTPVATSGSTTYKDGTYTGTVGSASQYGDVQVKVTIAGGKITDIEYLKFPSGPGHTDEVTAMAQPALKQEAIAAQSAKIDNVSGATQDTEGFVQTLQSALDQATS